MTARRDRRPHPRRHGPWVWLLVPLAAAVAALAAGAGYFVFAADEEAASASIPGEPFALEVALLTDELRPPSRGVFARLLHETGLDRVFARGGAPAGGPPSMSEDEVVDRAAALGPGAVPTLARYVGDAESVVAGAAVQALGQIGDPAALPALGGALRGHSDSWVRRRAIKAVARIDSAETVPLLIEALTMPDAAVRAEAAEALGERADPRAVPPLMAALSDSDPDVGYRAAWALGEMGDPRAVGPLIQALTRPARDSRTSRDSVAEAAARALGDLGDPRAVAPLSDAFRGAADEHFQVAVLSALGQIGDPSSLPLVVEAARRGTKDVRASAALSIGHLGDARHIGLLVELLDDPGEYVRANAAEALGWTGAGAEAILPAMTDPSIHVRRDAACALGYVGDPAGVAALAEAVVNPTSDSLRVAAAAALGDIGDPAGAPALTAALTDGDDDVRWVAAYALSFVAPESSVEALRARLTSRSHLERFVAIAGLLHAATPAAREALARGRAGQKPELARMIDRGLEESLEAALDGILEDPKSSMRYEAARVLAYLDTPESVRLLERFQHDRERGVRLTARRILRRLGRYRGPEASPPPASPEIVAPN